ncbi:MAG: alpha/beta hydrolase, partial [Thermoleophilaceae bacterium]
MAPREIAFPSGGGRCAAWHLRAEGEAFASERGRPCVVLAHGFVGTRDSGLLPYVERFAGAGLDALVFDYRHFGASDGAPRQLLSIRRQHEDYHSAIACARSLGGVDAGRIVLWGTSFSGGHVVAVAADDGRVAGAISQTPFTDGLATLRMLAAHAGVGQLVRLTAAGLRDGAAALVGREPVTVPAVAAPGALGMMTSEEAVPGYHAIAGPTWRNEVAARVLLRIGTYRPGARSADLSCPWLVQIADRDMVVPAAPAAAAARRAKGRAEVRRYPIRHFDVYVGEPFERAVADQLDFLRRHLAP